MVEHKQRVYLIEAKSSEKVDSSKLNFKKVVPLFEQTKEPISKHPIRCYVAAQTKEKKMLQLKEYGLFNPLWCYALKSK